MAEEATSQPADLSALQPAGLVRRPMGEPLSDSYAQWYYPPEPETQRPAPLTPEQRYEGEKNLVHLLIIAHDHGVEAAMAEWDRLVDAKEKARNSPDAR